MMYSGQYITPIAEICFNGLALLPKFAFFVKTVCESVSENVSEMNEFVEPK